MERALKMKNSMFTRSAAVIAAGSLILGVTACSDDDKDAVTSAVSSAVDSAKDAVTGTETQGSDPTASEGAEGAEDAATGEADPAQLSEGLKAAWDSFGGASGQLGALKSFETLDGNSLATFVKGWLTESKLGNVVPMIGEIGKTWLKDGGLKNKLGLPTGPESGDAANGWTQTFENGIISWIKDAAGSWKADIQQN